MIYYKTILNEKEFITLDDDGEIKGIPLDENNRDYQAYLAWVAEGNVAEEWNPGGSE